MVPVHASARYPTALGITFLLFAQPCRWIRLALAEFVKLQYGFTDLVIAMVIAIIVSKGQEILPGSAVFFLLRHLVFLFQQIFKDIPFHQGHFLIAAQTELRIHIDGVDILSDDTLAERMEGTDGCTGKQDLLTFQPGCRLALFRLLQGFPQSLVDALAHLAAAAFVNVTTSISSTLHSCARICEMMRATSTRVLPEPAAAATSIFLCRVLMAFS